MKTKGVGVLVEPPWRCELLEVGGTEEEFKD